jgi:uncharacterized protein involved in exopolysaccharide biosynthesis
MGSSSADSSVPNAPTVSLDFVKILGRRLNWLVFSGLVGLLLGAAYFLLWTPRYESKAEILLMQNDTGTISTTTETNQARLEKGGISEDLLATHMKLLQSHRIVTAALNHATDVAEEAQPDPEASDEEILADEEIVAAGEPGDESLEDPAVPQKRIRNLKSIQEQLTDDQTAAEYVIDNLFVTSGGSGRARNAHVLNVAFRHTSPAVSKVVLDAIISEYQAFVRSKFKDINTEAAKLIRKASDELEEEIGLLEEKYEAFRKDAPLLSRSASGSDIYTTRYEELAAELSQLSLERDEAESRLKMVKETLEELAGSDAHNLQKLALIDERNAERLGILVTVERGKAETAAFQAMQPERMAGATAEYNSLLTMKTRL